MYDGQYFSEDAMREREPYLHYEYIGKFQDMTGRRMSRPGERWSDTLMRRSEEAMLVAKIRSEQQRLGVPEKDWVGNERLQEEETDEMEEEEEELKVNENGGMAKEPDQGSIPQKKEIPSAEELQDRMEQFTILMQEKFLAGHDTEHVDYAKIDKHDETLDDR
uniref:CCD97-like C-terminal domain-containing protein n=1 Tax=Kalanchoe fedtschenkoi TaxID=63787 RepID=A0A7N0U0A3_KALFE